MKKILIILLIACGSCQEHKFSNPTQEKITLIDYLKTEYKVDPQIKRLDSIFIKKQISEKKSLNIDSLINSRIRIYHHKPLDLDFIEYNNRYYYRDSKENDCYSINLIRDNKTGNYYKDFISDHACIIDESFCSWSAVKKIASNLNNNITDEDAKAYNSINSNRNYGQNEIEFRNEKTGIRSYLNSAYKFNQPSKSQLDSLFYAYDRYYYYDNYTLLNSNNELYDFLRVQATKIRSLKNWGGLNKRLELLKDQINIILLQSNVILTDKIIFWIYKGDSDIRVRRLKISGNQQSSYSYNIDEYRCCF